MRILRFTASWCQPCKQLSLLLDDLNVHLPIEVIDIDIYPEHAVDYGVRSVPTMIKLDGNTEVKRMVGVKSKQEILEWLND